ncbi:IclR family transcriptional regulator [Natrinema salaciae]|uniref:DNA-binding transcriptional regulator, IclR family n=1 Tax=Natrinema salaciae TaxID=1186196 RepID=A0A1H9NQG4_9EURY|nr:IclR family transcriptional regulator [Natrinema salaciae]SER38141.1 DNA-binding transcriptional regulator, IclR family [Natrinema salaciae]
MESESESTGYVKSDQTVFAIIEEIHRSEEVGVTELATTLDMSKSAIHKHLKTLEKHGYVVNNDGRYGLGLKLLTLGGHIRDRDKFCRSVRSAIDELAEESDQMVSFILRDGTHGVFVFIENDRYGLRKPVPLGNRYVIHQNAAGKAILATLPDETIDGIIAETGLPSETNNTITEPDELWEDIETVREQGYATSVGERIDAIQSVAAAIESPETDQIGAISITGPADHFTQDRVHTTYAEMVMEATNELELRMRYALD